MVAVLDTGLATHGHRGDRRAQHHRLQKVEVHDDWDETDTIEVDPVTGEMFVVAGADEDIPDDNTDDFLDRQAGHGTFIAGIVRRLAPHAAVHIEGVLTSFGDGDDFSVTRSLDQLIDRLRKQGASLSRLIINLSFGGYTDNDEPPPVLTAAIDRLVERGVVFVAAAGNDNSARKLWPAALPDVIGVGALDSAGKAWFSNYGGWVDACAPGVDVVSTFFERNFGAGDFGTGFDPDDYRGFAQWSGTSFAAPKVAAAIADELQSLGSKATAQQAAKNVVYDYRKYRVADLGVVVNLV